MPWVHIAIGAALGIGAIIASSVFKVQRQEFKRTGKHPKGHYMGVGIAIGIPLGIPFGIAIGNIGLGPALGIPIGVAIGAALEKKNAEKLRPFTEKEEHMQYKLIAFLTGTLLLGIILLFFAGLS